jgi:hypothetical protein
MIPKPVANIQKKVKRGRLTFPDTAGEAEYVNGSGYGGGNVQIGTSGCLPQEAHGRPDAIGTGELVKIATVVSTTEDGDGWALLIFSGRSGPRKFRLTRHHGPCYWACPGRLRLLLDWIASLFLQAVALLVLLSQLNWYQSGSNCHAFMC